MRVRMPTCSLIVRHIIVRAQAVVVYSRACMYVCVYVCMYVCMYDQTLYEFFHIRFTCFLYTSWRSSSAVGQMTTTG